MNSERPYQPINCEFHDLMEATATRRTRAELQVRNADGSIAVLHGHIEDLFVRDHVEYMQLDGGRVLRLDDIIAIDGATPAGHGPALP